MKKFLTTILPAGLLVCGMHAELETGSNPACNTARMQRLAEVQDGGNVLGTFKIKDSRELRGIPAATVTNR